MLLLKLRLKILVEERTPQNMSTTLLSYIQSDLEVNLRNLGIYVIERTSGNRRQKMTPAQQNG